MLYNEFKQKVAGICMELSEIDTDSNWMIDEKHGHTSYIIVQNIQNPPEALGINYDERADKLTISASWPHGKNGQYLSPHRPCDHKGAWFSFGCSAAKTEIMIAKAIMKQLMDEYRAALTKIVREENDQQEREATRNGLAQSAATILGIPYKRDAKSNHGYPEVKLPYLTAKGIDSLEVEFAGETDIRFKIECSSMLLSVNLLDCLKKWIDANRIVKNPPLTIAERWDILLLNNARRETLTDFAMTHWDEEHMGSRPTFDDATIRLFAEHMKGDQHA